MILELFFRSTNIQQRTNQSRQTNDGRQPSIEEVNDADLGVPLPLAEIEIVTMHMFGRDIGKTPLPQFAHHHSSSLETAEIEGNVMELLTTIVVLPLG